MTILSIPLGRIEIEMYRKKYLTSQYLTKLTKKYQEYLKVLAVSMFLTIIPSVGTEASPHRFPDTEQHVAFTKGLSPVATVEPAVTIQPGESYAQAKEREAREAGRRTRRGQPLYVSLASANYPPCPASFRPFYQEVGPRFGVPWQVIEAIHQLESGKSCHTARRSSAGATGPMQFLPSTWRHYQWDCTGDGKADITNAYDSICTGAHYIGTGLTGNSLERSIFSYNHSWSYVNKVLSIAREIGFEG